MLKKRRHLLPPFLSNEPGHGNAYFPLKAEKSVHLWVPLQYIKNNFSSTVSLVYKFTHNKYLNKYQVFINKNIKVKASSKLTSVTKFLRDKLFQKKQVFLFLWNYCICDSVRPINMFEIYAKNNKSIMTHL
jgi:hypothetical protein